MLNLRRDVVGVVAVLLAGTVSPAEPSPTNVSVSRINAITIVACSSRRLGRRRRIDS
jgi:hypothetical protein